ncbi:MAG: relaxase/mobilization nuclease domain-containing protein [Parabacteroides sp.]|nr:relaxase/mobilization nuclease domain-containing protein [Parabacteroides sp.]
MVAKINVGKNLYGALAYNQNKVDEGEAKVLAAHLVRHPEDGRFRLDESMRQLLEWMPSHYRTEKPVIHISLNPHPDDVLTDGQLAEIGKEYMERLGYGNQPYLIFKHEDIDQHHIHIVSLRVDSEGKKVSDKFEHRRSKEITEFLEQKYDLHPAEGQKKGEEWQLKPVDVTKGDIKRQIARTLKPLLKLYRFQTMGELRALLSLYNIGIEEVKGEINGRTYHGILYTALDGDGETAATPIKSSRLGKMTGAEQLNAKMRESAAKIKSDPCRERLRPLVADALRQFVGERDFRDRLAKEQIDLVLRHNETGRIYGVTFIDHRSRTVLNGSRLGKEFSVNILNGRFQDQPQNVSSPLQPTVSPAVVPGHEDKILGGLLSDMEPELNYVPRHPKLLKPDKKKRRRRYGRQD